MRKYSAELIGTLFLVFVIGTAGRAAGSMAPVAIGGALMVMIYAMGHISGAHFNPAVTIGVWRRGKLPASEVAPYIIAQLIGGVCGAALAGVLFLPQLTPPDGNIGMIAIAEFALTFALVTVVLNVATSGETAGNSFYGLAIGSTVMAGAYSVGGISGGAFNPAVAVSLFIFSGLKAPIWVYLVAQIAAGAAAAYLFVFQNPDDR